MCGFVGYISTHKDINTINKMLKIQAYRGPDDSGVFVDNIRDKHIHFGHNRLSIQDTSSQAHQPFVSDCENYVIVYNGEVYNFKLIKTQLEKLGYKFISSSDTEVILYAYKAWGIKCLEKFIGMFAFSILDKKQNKMYLVRDRAGVKPLYYYVSDGNFIFSSELKSFHEHPSFIKSLNKDSLPYYFQFGYIPAPHTIYENTYKLNPGCYLEYDLKANSYEISSYWNVDDCYTKNKIDKNEKEVLNDLEDILTDSVNLRMISDVPVGVFLSGGYDSSLVTALLSKNSARDIHTFTIGFKDKKYNEAEHAKAIAKHFKTEHTEYYISNKDMLDKVESLPFFYDEPFGDSSAIPTMIVSEMARKDVTVALSADGGDEAFCGYSKYFLLNKFAPIFSSKFKQTMASGMLSLLDGKKAERINGILPKKIRQTNVRDKFNKLQRAIKSKSLEDMFINASSYVDKNIISDFLKVKPSAGLYSDFKIPKGLSFIDQMMLVDYKTFMVGDVLTKVDRATMSVSLEGREPLLDHRIIEYMARVPVSLKYKNNQGKYLSRQILYKYIPQALIDKPKAGFQIPLVEWLQRDLKPLVEKYLDASKLDEDVFNVSEVVGLKNQLFAGNPENVNAVWFILMYEMWKERWF